MGDQNVHIAPAPHPSVGDVGLDLLDMDDQVLAQDLDLVEKDKLVHAGSGLADIAHSNEAPGKKNGKEQAESQEDPFFIDRHHYLFL
jgi:hypothetical protein